MYIYIYIYRDEESNEQHEIINHSINQSTKGFIDEGFLDYLSSCGGLQSYHCFRGTPENKIERAINPSKQQQQQTQNIHSIRWLVFQKILYLFWGISGVYSPVSKEELESI